MPDSPSRNPVPAGMTSVAQARELILSRIVPVEGGEQTVALGDLPGRILAEDARAPFNVPGHDNSAMDGFAVRVADLAADQESELSVVGAAFAGAPFAGTFAAGECVKIMTGAVLPPAADVVVPKEETRPAGADRVVVAPRVRRAGLNTRRAGEDLRKGEVALSAGTLVGPAEVGLLGSLGLAEVKVKRRLRVAHFSTGDELRSPGEALREGELYDSNRRTIGAMLARMHVEVKDLGVVRDDRAALTAAFDRAAAWADAVVTSGGASVGEADFIRDILAERGEALFWKVAMRPGRPLAYGKVGDADFFGLPGNPVSVMVCFCQFVRDALWQRAGRTGRMADWGGAMFAATAATELRKAPGRMEFQRGIVRQNAAGEWTARSVGDQGSGILSSMTRANCFIVLAEERGTVAAGETVWVQPFAGIL